MTIDEVNAILNAMTIEHVVEPIDDITQEVNFWDWADVLGIVDQFEPADYI